MKINDIRLLEVELHSYCNRTCKWCPNSYIDRKSSVKFLDDNIFNKLIYELKDNNFSGIISFSRYNEPFAQPDDLEKSIFMINTLLPNVKLVTNTNGDYNFDKFKHLLEITEMDYDNNKDSVITDNFRIMKLSSINNRGGLLDIKNSYNRNIPCYEPQFFVGINYDGTVSPCCNIRNDVEKHKDYILGDLHNNTLEEILNTDFAKSFRFDVANMNFPNICKHCDKKPGRYTSNKGIGGEQT